MSSVKKASGPPRKRISSTTTTAHDTLLSTRSKPLKTKKSNIRHGENASTTIPTDIAAAGPSSSRSTRKRVPAKANSWMEYSQVSTPAERVRYLQLCHDFVMDSCSASAISSCSSSYPPTVLPRLSILPSFGIVQRKRGIIKADLPGKCSRDCIIAGQDCNRNSHNDTACITEATSLPVYFNGVPGSNIVQRCVACSNPISPTDADRQNDADFAKDSTVTTTTLSHYAYVHPTAPRPYSPCCTLCIQTAQRT